MPGTLARRDRAGAWALSDDVAINERRALTILAAVTLPVLVVLLLLGLVLGGWLAALVLGFGLTLPWAAYVRWGGPNAARGAIGGTVADRVAHARLHNLVEGLCGAVGVPKPELRVVDDPAPNALVYGRDARASTLLVTSGLLASLSRIELEGILARELTSIRNGDVRPATTAVAVLRVLGSVTPVAERIRRAAARTTIVEADANGVAVTRYPPGLAAAFEKVRADGRAVQARSVRTDHLWVVPPEDGPTPAHPPLEERIEALREL